MDNESFPILGTNLSIPWSVIRSHEFQAQKNHGQTLKRLSERGGLDWTEALAVLTDQPWSRMDETKAKHQVLQIVANLYFKGE